MEASIFSDEDIESLRNEAFSSVMSDTKGCNLNFLPDIISITVMTTISLTLTYIRRKHAIFELETERDI